MPATSPIERAREDRAAGKSASTQAGEFVREEIHRIRKGYHGARSPEQAIAIGLSMARRAGVELPPPAVGKVSAETRRKAQLDVEKARHHARPSPKRSRSRVRVLQHEPISTVSPEALSEHAKKVARRRGHADLARAAEKAARTRAHQST